MTQVEAETRKVPNVAADPASLPVPAQATEELEKKIEKANEGKESVKAAEDAPEAPAKTTESVKTGGTSVTGEPNRSSK